MTEHTPGPWIIRHGTNIMADWRAIASCGGYASSSDWDGDITRENEANARLIASAPDLLAACEAVRRAESLAGVDRSAFEDAFIEACKLVDAALAKARQP